MRTIITQAERYRVNRLISKVEPAVHRAFLEYFVEQDPTLGRTYAWMMDHFARFLPEILASEPAQ